MERNRNSIDPFPVTVPQIDEKCSLKKSNQIIQSITHTQLLIISISTAI